MIVRNLESEVVKKRWYKAHGGGLATMLFDSNELQGILFYAFAALEPDKVLETHIDPYEEIYFILQGGALMKVGDDEQQVTAGDAIWLPHGISHGMVNNTKEDCIVMVSAAMPRED